MSNTPYYDSYPSTIPQSYDPDDTICFYRRYEPYFEFSNFYEAPIEVDGLHYPTSEHYYQAQKFVDTHPDIAEEIRHSERARDAKNLSQKYEHYTHPSWNATRKIEAMERALRAKFGQHDELRQLLLETGDRILVEHTKNDAFWGDAGDGTGRNELGKALMKVRREFREQE